MNVYKIPVRGSAPESYHAWPNAISGVRRPTYTVEIHDIDVSLPMFQTNWSMFHCRCFKRSDRCFTADVSNELIDVSLPIFQTDVLMTSPDPVALRYLSVPFGALRCLVGLRSFRTQAFRTLVVSYTDSCFVYGTKSCFVHWLWVTDFYLKYTTYALIIEFVVIHPQMFYNVSAWSKAILLESESFVDNKCISFIRTAR